MLDFAALTAGSIEPITAGDVVRACDLADQYAVRAGARLAARDLLHAAVMLRAEGARRRSSAVGFYEVLIVGCGTITFERRCYPYSEIYRPTERH